MQDVILHDVIFQKSATPRLYTLNEAASRLGIREDDLLVLLPDTAIAMETWTFQSFTHSDVELLGKLISIIREYAAESAYGGGEL